MKRFLAVLLAAGTLLACCPLSASALEGEEEPALPAAAEESPSPFGLEEDPSEPSSDSDSSGSEDSPEPTPEPDPSPEPGPTPTPTPAPDPTPITPGLETAEHVTYITGTKDMVNPDGKLTRAEAASMIYSLLESVPQWDPDEPTGFTDVRPNDWFAEKVQGLSRIGALKGYADGTFRPGKTISRAEFVVVLFRFFPMEEPSDTVFADVDPEDYPWACRQIALAADKGWIEGYAGGIFKPDDPVTRAQAVKIINRALDRTPDRAKLDADGKVLLFLDLPYSHWAYYEIMEAALPHSPVTEDVDTESWLSYTVPAASRKPGYHSINGELYKVDGGGHWVRNATDGVLKFDNNGRYTTGNAALDSQLTALVKANTVSSDTLLNNYRRLYRYVVNHCNYRGGSYLLDGQTGWEPSLALEMAKNKKGNCYRFAALTTMLARKMGYQATGISGYINTGSGFVPHGWTEIRLDGKTWLCDSEIQYAGGLDLFMKSYSGVSPHYRVKGISK